MENLLYVGDQAKNGTEPQVISYLLVNVKDFFHEVANKILRTIVFLVLREDEVTRAIRYDQLIILYGNKLCLKYGLQHQHDMIRSRLRLLGHYLIAFRIKDEKITDLASLYDPKFYDVAIAAVNSGRF